MRPVLGSVLGVVALLGMTVSCGGSTTAPTPQAPLILRGDVTDPTGDTASDARVPRPPDLVGGTFTVGNGSLMVSITFAPQAHSRATTRVTVALDTDQNPGTGISQAGFRLGADYSLDLVSASGRVTVLKADPVGCAARQSCFNEVGSAEIVFAGDTIQTVIPLSLLGGATGRMGFEVSSYVMVAPLEAVSFDYMPDIAIAPGHVQ